MSSEASTPKLRRPEPDLETVPLAKTTRKTIERLAPFCQMRLPPNSPNVPLVPKTNSKILRFMQAVDTSMLVAQIGYRLASDAASLCDPFAPPNSAINGTKRTLPAPTPEMLQMMAAHGHSHALKTSETFRDVQQEIYKIAAVTKDNDVIVLVPPDPQQPATLRKALKDVGSDLVANLNLLSQFSRGMLDLTSWWEWLEEELMVPNSTLLPSLDQRDAELYARWSKIKGGYLDYYNAIRVVYTRYPQLLTTSSTAWQSTSSVPPPPSSPGSSWDGSFQDLGAIATASAEEFPEREAEGRTEVPEKAQEQEKKGGKAKSVKSVKNVKVFVSKFRLAKVLRRKKGDEGDREAEPKKGKKKGKGKRKEEVQGRDEKHPTDGSRPADKVELAMLPKETSATEVGDRRSTHSSGAASSTSISKSEKKSKGRIAKALALLRRGLARLGCHNPQVDD